MATDPLKPPFSRESGEEDPDLAEADASSNHPAPGETSEWYAGPEAQDMRFDRYLSSFLPGFSRMRLQSLIRSGHATLRGAATRPSEPVQSGDAIRIEIPENKIPDTLIPLDMDLEILFEDSDLLVLNKPAGLVVHPGAGAKEETLVHALLHHCKDLSGIGGVERPGIVHRLDKETSGCLVVAKNDVAHRSLAAQFADRSVQKVYLAAVKGIPRRPHGIIDAEIGCHPVHRQRMAVTEEGRGRASVTGYRVLAKGEGISLLECKPQTGRTHQIRVHLKHLGCPILGDPVYGSRGTFLRHMLHAWKLTFVHPVTGAARGFTAAVPADFPLLPPSEA